MGELMTEGEGVSEPLSYARRPPRYEDPVIRRVLAGMVGFIVSALALTLTLAMTSAVGAPILLFLAFLGYVALVIVWEMCDANLSRMMFGMRLTFPEKDGHLRRLVRAMLIHPVLMAVLVTALLGSFMERLPFTPWTIVSLVGAVCLADFFVLNLAGRRVGDIVTGARIVRA